MRKTEVKGVKLAEGGMVVGTGWWIHGVQDILLFT